MQFNLYSILSTALAFSSIFLPWVTYSGTYASLTGVSFSTENISPVKWSTRIGRCPIDCSSFSFYHNTEWLQWPQTHASTDLPSLLLAFLPVVSFLIFSYSICLTTHSIFAHGSWSKSGKYILIVAGLLSLSGILLIQGHYLSALGRIVGINPVKDGLFSIGLVEGEGYVWLYSTYFNVGFFTAISSTVLTVLAWLRPKWIVLQVEVSGETVEKIKDWFNLSEMEKLATIFLSSFLILLFFTLFYLVPPS